MESNKIASPQGTQPAHGARSRAGAHNTQDSTDVGSGGFLALLAALGTDDLAVDPLAEPPVAADAAVLQGAADGQDASFLAAWQGLLAPGANARADAMTPPQTGGALGGAGAGAQAASVAALEAGWAGGAAPGADMAFGANGAVQGIVAETALLDASGGARSGLALASGSAPGRAFSRLQGALAQKADALEAAAGRLPSGSAHAALGGPSANAGMVSINPAERLAGVGGFALPERASGTQVRDSGAGTGLAAALMEGAATPLVAAGGGGADARSRQGEGRSDGTPGFDGAGLAAPAEAGAVDGASVFADPAQAGLEEQIAEQVAYWVNQKTQNAELTLDRDGQPVEVSVTLSGNEAHVAFRSDQSATRDLLDKSMAQLSELLRSEGLVLSGMSVGTSSGQREAGGDSARQGQREGGRQARVEAAAPAGSGTLLRTGAADRAVDVFV